MVHLLVVQAYLAESTGLPLPFLVRLPAILADPGALILARQTLTPTPDKRGRLSALLVFAAAPSLVMISEFQGNTDPVTIAFVVLAVYLLERRSAVIPAGMDLGLARIIKIVPVHFLPGLVCSRATRVARLTLGVVTAAT